ncbi:UTRA domain-containing protein [Sphingomonas sp. MAH-20]|jgi:GntR family histidine utilization transcriptional repressor|uniref:UTRA domain-containing protein n=1 Tax=Sphingomonas horti TaxID=2682842 RepID=A0A6I4J2T1_9SPHN|nr:MULTISPECIES: UTRA domain-containing protein [Sphingomonas]MBA2918897.1 UTRA domain-containing protein [Sphingomonas sp. CGMCC 1.13658]MVO78930.1 UTRA domain-containing protein [Sphingomonas horti]
MTIEARIRADLEHRIRSGELRPGARIPFEHELVAHYGCARATVGKALASLARAGLIERRRKAGSFVAHPHSEAAVLDIPDIGAAVAARGGGYRFERIARVAEQGDASPFAPGTELLRLEGVHHAIDGPFAHELRWISLAVVPDARAEPFEAVAPGVWLLDHVPWSEAEHRISATGATGDIATCLQLPRGTPCLRLTRTTWRNGEPVTHVRQTFPGDRYDLVARFTPAGR